VVVASYDGWISIVDANDFSIRSFSVHAGAVKAVAAVTPRRFVSCGADGSVASWTLDGDVADLYRHDAIANDVACHGQRVVSVGRDFTARVFDLESLEIAVIPLAHRSPKSVCFLSSDHILVGDYWGYLTWLHITRRGAIRELKVADNGISALTTTDHGALACSYDGQILLVGKEPQRVLARLSLMTQRPAAAEPSIDLTGALATR
jgi:WD40 repeat protein